MPVDPAALDDSLGQLEDSLAGSTDVSGQIQTVVDAADQLFRCSGAGLMMIDADQVLRYVAATDEAGRVLETAQEQAGQGPCVDSWVYEHVVQTKDVTSDDRWPRLGPLLEPHCVRAVIGAPVLVGGATVGTLNIYADDPFTWDESQVVAILGFRRILDGVLGAAVLAQRNDAVVQQLQHALEHRVVIERAIGLLMGRDDLSATEAFERLRHAARRSRGKVADLATGLLEGTPLPQ